MDRKGQSYTKTDGIYRDIWAEAQQICTTPDRPLYLPYGAVDGEGKVEMGVTKNRKWPLH